MSEIKGRIADVQRFSTQDGPGIRTTVFLKGCSLSCRWCHNPETIDPRPGVGWTERLCTHCGLCAAACPAGAVAPGRAFFDRAACIVCGACVEACPEDALRLWGEEKTPEELLGLLLRDRGFYRNSGGGVTFSGGEPLLQSEFTGEVFALCRAEGIDTALDTAGHVPFSAFEAVLPVTSRVLLDIKMTDTEKHRRYTGAGNERILANLRELLAAGVPMEVRIPLMHGVNDDEENIAATAALLMGRENVYKVKLLPYHDLGLHKRAMAGLGEGETFAPPDGAHLAKLAALFDRPVEF